MRVNKLSLMVLVAVALATADASGAVQYTVTDLGTLGGSRSWAADINNSGQVTGKAESTDNIHYAFRTAPNSPINPATDNLGTLGGTNGSFATGINDSGQVVGNSYTAAGYQHAFRTAPNSPVNPATDDLHPLDLAYASMHSYAYAMNTSGQVVAWVGQTFFRTAPNSRINPTTDGGYAGRLFGINDSGAVVGDGIWIGDPAKSENYIPLGSLAGRDTWASDINASGLVIGGSQGNDGQYHAFCTAPYSPIDPATDDLGISYAEDINANGQVVGSLGQNINGTNIQSAFLYENGTMTNLNSLIDPATGCNLQSAVAINDLGQIVCDGLNSLGQERAFLLTPVPEPSSIVLLTMAGLGLLAYAWRRRQS